MTSFREIETNLDKYINQVIKYQLDYIETYTFEFKNNCIIIKSEIPCQLSIILQNRIDIKINLKNYVTYKLKSIISDIYDVDIKTNDFDITIHFSFMSDLIDTIPINSPINVYIDIASKLREDNLEIFCNNNKIINICNSPKFWIRMIKYRFPQYYLFKTNKKNKSVTFDKKVIYHGLMYYEESKNDEDIDASLLFFNRIYELTTWDILYHKYPDTFDYLILNDLVTLSKDIYEHILMRCNLRYIIKHLLKRYPINIYIYYKIISSYFNYIDIIKLLFSGKFKDEQGNILSDKNIDIVYLKNAYDEFLYKYNHITTLEEFKFWYKFFGGDYTYDSIINYILNLYDINEDVINYIQDKLASEIPIDDLMNYLHIGISFYKITSFKMIFKRYRFLLNINMLKNIINDESGDDFFESETAENFINIIEN